MASDETRTWCTAQLDAARLPQAVRTAVERLLEVYWTMNHTPETREQTLHVFESLANERALIEQSNPDEVWVDARPGQLTVADEVRVKTDAYSPEKGAQFHNGRRGRIVGIRYGDIIVDYRDGIHPEYRGVRHPPAKLERRVR